jgi:hypothetical protein
VKYPTEKEVQKNLGKRIVALRKEKGISQSDLCYSIDIDLSTLSRLERGILNVTFTTLYKIAKYFDVGINDLFKE